MAGPICRWRNPYIQTVIEFIELLPKEELSKERAREIVERDFPDFYRTPYQLACQLVLYYELMVATFLSLHLFQQKKKLIDT